MMLSNDRMLKKKDYDKQYYQQNKDRMNKQSADSRRQRKKREEDKNELGYILLFSYMKYLSYLAMARTQLLCCSEEVKIKMLDWLETIQIKAELIKQIFASSFDCEIHEFIVRSKEVDCRLINLMSSEVWDEPMPDDFPFEKGRGIPFKRINDQIFV